ncbi:glycosyltransferase [Kocuria sp. LUK]|uniref:glycosyltransferase n=1 Tax=Kocuria sp. LUK TaxID=2897828 RepID=UPI001E47197D|nr:glycosyltransferase [Kocuria sp. LUK]MCD1144959.1 glycosyltransferase [Kocuria sp. LUK]
MIDNVFVLSTADFNADVWTNKQHLASRLADHVDVTYIESLGLRRPVISKADLARIATRATRYAAPATLERSTSRLRIIKPHVLPLHGLAAARAINGRLFNTQVHKLVAQSKGTTLLWSFSPVTYGIEKHFDKTVYHSVDLLHTLPNLPAQFLLESERNLVKHADEVIASSTGVKDHLSAMTNKSIRLWQNVADTRLYANANGNQRRSRAIFAGNLTPGKVDFKLLFDIARSGMELLLAGPHAIDGTNTSRDLTDLLQYPNVRYLGNLRPPELASALNACTVGLIPYHVNEYTTGVFPMKVYEYLASGLSVVSTPLPSLVHVADQDIHVASGSQFAETTTRVADVDKETIVERRRRAAKHSWESRTAQALDLLTREK